MAFTPKLLSILRVGYSLKTLHADALAGLTLALALAIAALPLAMAVLARGRLDTQHPGLHFTEDYGSAIRKARDLLQKACA